MSLVCLVCLSGVGPGAFSSSLVAILVWHSVSKWSFRSLTSVETILCIVLFCCSHHGVSEPSPRKRAQRRADFVVTKYDDARTKAQEAKASEGAIRPSLRMLKSGEVFVDNAEVQVADTFRDLMVLWRMPCSCFFFLCHVSLCSHH